MIDIIKKAVFASAGFAFLTKERVQELGKKLSEDAKLSEKEGKELVEELQKKADDTKLNIEKMVKSIVEKTLVSLHIPTRDEVLGLQERIAQLEKKFDEQVNKE